MAKSISTDPRTSPPVRVSYPTVFTARSVLGGNPSYGVVLMFDKKDKEHMDFLRQIHADVQSILTRAWPDEAKRPRVPIIGYTDSPIKDGDVTANRQGVPIGEKNPEYRGHYIIRAGRMEQNGPPAVVDRNRQEILDKAAVYGGCWCKVNINCYQRLQPTNPGVSIGLNGLQKWADDESFGGGRPSVESMFTSDGSDDPSAYAPDPFAQNANQRHMTQSPADPFAAPDPRRISQPAYDVAGTKPVGSNQGNPFESGARQRPSDDPFGDDDMPF